MKNKSTSTIFCAAAFIFSGFISAMHNSYCAEDLECEDRHYDPELLTLTPLEDFNGSENLMRAFVKETKLFSYLTKANLSSSSLYHARYMAWIQSMHDQHLPAAVGAYPPKFDEPIVMFREIPRSWLLSVGSQAGLSVDLTQLDASLYSKYKKYKQDFELWLPDAQESVILKVTGCIKRGLIKSYKVESVTVVMVHGRPIEERVKELEEQAEEARKAKEANTFHRPEDIDAFKYDPNRIY